MMLEQRRVAIEQAKLAPPLIKKLEAYRKAKRAKPEVVEVQVWISNLPPGRLAKLKSFGFTFTASLTPNRLLGTVALDRLDAMLQGPFVWRVESPKRK